MTDIVQIQESEYDAIQRQAVAVIPWGHILTLMCKFDEDDNAIILCTGNHIKRLES